MFAGGDPVLANDDPVCISVDFDRTPDRARLHRIFVVIEPDKAGLGDRGWHRMEAVEPAGIGNKLQPLRSLGSHGARFGQTRQTRARATKWIDVHALCVFSAAQREACAAFILSQKHEGWTVVAGAL